MHQQQVPLQRQQLRAGLQRSDGGERLTLQTKNADVCRETSNSAFMDKSH